MAAQLFNLRHLQKLQGSMDIRSCRPTEKKYFGLGQLLSWWDCPISKFRS